MFLLSILDWLEKLMLPCLFKMLFHTDCPGCGLQRSIFLLVRGNIKESIQLYWATIPILLLFVFLLLHIKFKFKQGNKILIGFYCFNAILILCQFFYKLTS